jgi:hypothetical protein
LGENRGVPVPGQFRESVGRDILFTPIQTGEIRHNVFFDGAVRQEFGNKIIVQFLERRGIFARENISSAVSAVLECCRSLVSLDHTNLCAEPDRT